MVRVRVGVRVRIVRGGVLASIYVLIPPYIRIGLGLGLDALELLHLPHE